LEVQTLKKPSWKNHSEQGQFLKSPPKRKKSQIFPEPLRGKTGRAYGNLVSL